MDYRDLSNKHLSRRLLSLRPSGVRRIFDLAAASKDPLNLSIGEPDFDVPEMIKDEAISWIKKGFNKYTPSGGIPELRGKISLYLKEKGINFEDVIVTPGVTGALLLAFMVVLDPGDEVLIPDPYFVLYEYQIKLLGGKPVFFDTYPDFRLREDSLRSVLSERSKVILINSPNNPTGIVYSREELEMVANVARERGMIVFSDDIYDAFIYEPSKVAHVSQFYENVISFGGFSKTYGMTGWRVGYAAGPKTLIDFMVTMQQYVFSGVNSPAQKAALFALDYDMENVIAEYRKKRDLIYEGLKDKFRVVKPEGAYYIFPEVPGGDAESFVEKALKKNLFIVPGNVFSSRNTHVRISYAVPDDVLIRAIEILRRLA